MRTDLFDYELPDDRIALHPARPRDAARLLVVRPCSPSPRLRGEARREGQQTAAQAFAPHRLGEAELRSGPLPIAQTAQWGEGNSFEDRIVRELPKLLSPGDALVMNDTRVIPAALAGVRMRGTAQARVSFNLTERIDVSRWRALARPAKRLEVGDRVRLGEEQGETCLLGTLDATVSEKGEAGEVELAFDFSGPDLDRAIAAAGSMPLPPYIAAKRAPGASDRIDYQTVFAAHEGAVAAPTAGLHFTPELIAALNARGVSCHFVTLHVGAGTFLPVKTEDTSAHKMHAEHGQISKETADAINAARAAGGRIVAVGTTSLRLLESAADEEGRVHPFSGSTSIFITPGYWFKAVDILMTNFHLPRSTLLMLVAAFSGLETIKAAYAHALLSGYRFYSYGDACLLFGERGGD